MRRKWHYYTNGIDEISVYEDDIPPEGFYLGRKPMSAETRARQSASAKRRPSNTKGKKLSDTARHNMSVSKNSFLQIILNGKVQHNGNKVTLLGTKVFQCVQNPVQS